MAFCHHLSLFCRLWSQPKLEDCIPPTLPTQFLKINLKKIHATQIPLILRVHVMLKKFTIQEKISEFTFLIHVNFRFENSNFNFLHSRAIVVG